MCPHPKLGEATLRYALHAPGGTHVRLTASDVQMAIVLTVIGAYLHLIYYYIPLPLNLADKQQQQTTTRHFSLPFWPLLPLNALGSTLL